MYQDHRRTLSARLIVQSSTVYLSIASFQYDPQSVESTVSITEKSANLVQIILALQSKRPSRGHGQRLKYRLVLRSSECSRVRGSRWIRWKGLELNVIEAESLSKIYHRSRTQALSDITLTIGRGEIFTLLGRNGAGKTTFLRIAATQLMLSKGSISVLGHDVRDEPLQIRSKIAVVPQEGSTIGPLTPWDHVYLTLLARGMSRNQAHERSEKTIERLELTEYRNQPADSLSGGLKQRVRVAMAVATDAELIFLDEPTLGLDAVTRRRIWGVLNEIQKEGRSILLTTHYIDEAEILSK